MLIYCMSYIGFGKDVLGDITKAFLGPPQHKFQYCMKNDDNGLSHFSVFGQNWKFCPNTGKY